MSFSPSAQEGRLEENALKLYLDKFRLDKEKGSSWLWRLLASGISEGSGGMSSILGKNLIFYWRKMGSSAWECSDTHSFFFRSYIYSTITEVLLCVRPYGVWVTDTWSLCSKCALSCREIKHGPQPWFKKPVIRDFGGMHIGLGRRLSCQPFHPMLWMNSWKSWGAEAIYLRDHLSWSAQGTGRACWGCFSRKRSSHWLCGQRSNFNGGQWRETISFLPVMGVVKETWVKVRRDCWERTNHYH